MKIVLLHPTLDSIGGAEMFVNIISRELNADIYTTNVNREFVKRMGFEENLKRIYSIGKVPNRWPFKHQSILNKFRRLNLSNRKKKYDFFIITGEWAISGAKNNKPNLIYFHSPIREFYDLYDYTKNKIAKYIFKFHFMLWVKINKHLHEKYLNKVNIITANSLNTKSRVSKFLNKKSVLLYPPVETWNYKYKKNGDFWLSVNRLIDHKRVDMQLRAFSKLPNEKLVIIGSYEKSEAWLKYIKYLYSIKPKNVEIINHASNEEKINLYANCKGFITTGLDEDFGVTPIEAMASGKPVIAPNEGGYKETIIDGKTGILIDNINEDKLIEAIKVISKNPSKYRKECEEQARKFDTKYFIKKLNEVIENKNG